MTEETKAPRKRTRAKAELVAGNWVDGNFKPWLMQPEQPVTNVADMAAWAREQMGNEPGEVEFIRRVPGKLVLAVQTTMKFKAVA